MQIVITSMILTWSGFIFGALMAKLFRLPLADILAVSIETGVQNTGVAIVLLRFSLGQPAADMTLGEIFKRTFFQIIAFELL
jgi:sodium/bile acid cotransporter 3/5